MEGSRPLLSAELEFFTKGTGNGKALAILSSALCILPNTTSIVPLITIFTKFDAQIIQEYVKMNQNDTEDQSHRWDKARENADNTFKEIYLSKVLKANYPPKAYVKLEGRIWTFIMDVFYRIHLF